ncbi:MATE family efflux transporter [Photobacterium phosphoreum]|uniref:MATE family efflux transporter n=1 Tax=Photobacterium phosphoreum TaxID=659 RepID=UPI001E500808|nr:MATE family efflux transporter [Photobacterium phosphoreum]MCD9477282.1 hypothetical protein [Photobacterium phosphoreum]MCF2178100.1 hypothetical protein [Photobacterium phosphoreum]
MYLLSYIIAKEVKAVDAGQIFLLQTIIVICGLFASLGLNGYIPKIIGQSSNLEDSRDEVLLILLLTLILSAIITFVLIFFILDSIINVNYFILFKLYLSLSICIFCHALLVVFSSFFQGVKKPASSVIYLSIIQPILLMVIILIKDISLVNILDYLVISYLMTLFVCVIHLFIGYKNFFFHTISFDKMENITNVLPFFFILLLLSILINQMPLILSTIVLNSNEIAILQVALKVSASVGIVITAVNTVVAPIFSKLYSKNEILALKKLYVNSTIFILFITIPLLISIYFYSYDIMTWFGPNYSEYTIFLKILLIGQFFNVLSGPSACLLTMLGMYKKVIYGNLINAGFILIGLLISSIVSNINSMFILFISLGLLMSNIYWLYIILKKIGLLSSKEVNYG